MIHRLPRGDNLIPPSGEIPLLLDLQRLVKLNWTGVSISLSMTATATSTHLVQSLALDRVFACVDGVYSASGTPRELLAQYCRGNVMYTAIAATILKDLIGADQPAKQQHVVRYYRYLVLGILADLGYTVLLPISDQLHLIHSLIRLLLVHHTANLDFLLESMSKLRPVKIPAKTVSGAVQ
jgi:hypothetical protein